MPVVVLSSVGQDFHNKTWNTCKRYILTISHVADDGNVGNNDFIIIFTPFILYTVTENTASAVFDLVADLDNEIVYNHGMFQICLA